MGSEDQVKIYFKETPDHFSGELTKLRTNFSVQTQPQLKAK